MAGPLGSAVETQMENRLIVRKGFTDEKPLQRSLARPGPATRELGPYSDFAFCVKPEFFQNEISRCRDARQVHFSDLEFGGPDSLAGGMWRVSAGVELLANGAVSAQWHLLY